MTPVWLKTLFLKWQAARGDRLPEAKLADTDPAGPFYSASVLA
jgi:hypothetical protein